MGTYDRFKSLQASIQLDANQIEDGRTKHRGVRTCLNQHYYNVSAWDRNSMLIGSWGKDTAVSPPRDIDVLFVLPDEAYYRYQQRPGNKQSQLLQEVKSVLARRYPRTDIGGDGQVVVVPFSSQTVEVAPAFLLASGQYLTCDTNDGGSYKTSDPKAEIAKVKQSDTDSGGNARHLIRMAKCWQWWKDVPVKSFTLELVAVHFLETWEYAGKSYTYYDWMFRDFLAFLVGEARSFELVPGTNNILWLGDDWKSRAETALSTAKRACQLEGEEKYAEASVEWQKLFSSYHFPSS